LLLVVELLECRELGFAFAILLGSDEGGKTAELLPQLWRRIKELR
jgi:Flp pilus assembly protein TadB